MDSMKLHQRILIIILGLIIFSMSCVAVLDDADAWFSFRPGGTLVDETGTYTAIKVSSPVNTTGVLDRGYKFDSASEYLNTTFKLGSVTSFFMTFWVNSTTDLIARFVIGDADGDFTDNVAWHLATNADGSQPNFLMTTTSSNNAGDFFGTNTWNHVILEYNGTHMNQYINNSLISTASKTGTQNLLNTVLIGYTEGTNSNTHVLDEFGIYLNRTSTSSERTQLFNNGTGYNPYDPGALSNFTITAKDGQGKTLNVFNASVNGTIYSTSSGTITTLIPNNESFLFNVTVFAFNHYNYSGAINMSGDLQANLSSYFVWSNVTFANYHQYSGVNYTRNLSYSINVSCPDFSNTSLDVIVNDSKISSTTLSCANTSFLTPTYYYKAGFEGPYNISIYLNTTLYPENNSAWMRNQSFTSDLNDPGVSVTFDVFNGFANASSQVSLFCNDTVTPILTYNLTFNKVGLLYGNQTRGTNITNSTGPVNGLNNATGTCADFFGSSSANYSDTIYLKNLILIDEIDNVLFNVSNITGARVYFDDNSSYYDFKDNNASAVNFSSLVNDKLRFELTYSDAAIVTRYVDVSLISNDEIRVCANKEGVTHYEQLIVSASQKPVVLKSVFANCMIAADYTRFAYQDAYLLKAFTIARMYYLYTFEAANQIFLASIDGSISTYVNLDQLEFNQEGYELDILNSVIGISKNTNQSMNIYYRNPANDSASINVTITKMDTNTVVFSSSSPEIVNPNEFTVLFDFTTLNVTNETLFRVDVTSMNSDGEASTLKRYFNTLASVATTNRPFAIVIGLILLIAGFSFAITRLSFSWFGIFMLIGSIGFLSSTISTWYVKFFIAIDLILLVYTIVIMVKKNYPTVA